MKKGIQELLDNAKKLATLTNILIITIVCILVYFIYQLVKKCNISDPVKEGFVAQKELTDLLDKLRVKLYEKENVWNNELFNEQPDRKEKASSFWEAKNETGQPFKRAGQCISTNEEYDMPNKNTMLIDGDVKAPVDSKFIFQFPDNIITRNEKDSKEYNVFTGIRKLKDIEERLEKLNGVYQTLSKNKEDQMNIVTDMENLVKSKVNVKVYGKNSYFNKTPMFTVKNNQSLTLPNNKYSSISFPLGSKLSLQSEHGNGSLDLELPIDMLLKSSGEQKDFNSSLYNDVVAKLGLDGSDFNVFGNYGLNAVNAYENGVVNNKDNSTESKEYNQDANTVYSPNNHKETVLRGAAKVLTLGISDAVPQIVRYSFNHAISSGGDTEHTMYGRNDLYEFAKDNLIDKSDDEKINPQGIYYSSKYINFNNEDKIFGLRKRNDKLPDISLSSNTLSHPYFTKTRDSETLDTSNVVNFKDEITKNKQENYWFNINLPDKNINTQIDTSLYYVNLAFMFTTMKKVLDTTGDFVSNVDGKNCCNIGDITEESLSRNPNFQGYLTTGTIDLNIPDNKNPLLYNVNVVKNDILAVMDSGLSQVSTMINQLDNLKRSILENRFQHFPLKIYRPIPPKNYVSLGDVIFNHRNLNYNIRQPILDNIATIPKQCYKEVRDWLSVDKVYEHRNGDTYLAIFKNPYLQTFKAVTVPDTMPPGRVGKVVACVEGCRLLDDIIEADKCSKKFFKANKEIIEGTNLDPDNTIVSRESTLYKNKIQNKQDRINTLKEVARRLQIQDDKANIINKQYNKQKLQNLVDTQRRNINTLVDELEDGNNRIDINVKFNYEKFQGLITVLEENDRLPPRVSEEIRNTVDVVAKKKLDVLPDETVKDVLSKCPTPDTEGLVVKALVESGCYNCYNLK